MGRVADSDERYHSGVSRGRARLAGGGGAAAAGAGAVAGDGPRGAREGRGGRAGRIRTGDLRDPNAAR